jgi:hypothetical protein
LISSAAIPMLEFAAFVALGSRAQTSGDVVFATEQAVVQVIENRADIKGRVLSVAPIAERPDHRLVAIEVSGVSPVAGYANLFTGAPGTRLDVVVPASQADALRVGGNVDCRVRRGGPTTVIGDRCSEQ